MHRPRSLSGDRAFARRRLQRTPGGLVVQLLRFVRDYDLEEACRVASDRAEEAVLIPRIVCSEALL
ncbi:MAG: hypothetical protein KAW49_13755 [Anaerolineae bacterium]|nr:hypothetical protein [Anaerolineae bacterium]